MILPPLACAMALLVTCMAVGAEPRNTAIAAESASLLGNPRVFVAGYDPLTDAGDVVARRASDLEGTAALWSAARMLDQPTDAAIAARLVLTSDGQQAGIPLSWPTLPPALRASLTSQGLDERRLAYLRGARSGESVEGLRPRASRLGGILNANLWYVGHRAVASSARRGWVFAGANDGMLHGFDAQDGSEKIAYVPQGLLPRLSALTRPSGTHSHLVDGPLFAANAPVGVNGVARTLLVGALGAGGKGFYALDVTDPDQFSAARAAEIVWLDQTAGDDADLGHIYAPPVVAEADPHHAQQIVRLNNRRWAAVMGNGYFSANGQPVLLIQYLDGGRELQKLSPCAPGRPCAFAGHNGLSAPRLIDLDGDGMVDIAYAGDLQGHLWRFDLTGASAGSAGSADREGWRVAFAGRPLFVARDATGQRQPISTAPYWMPHPQGGVMLVVGTGRHLERRDTASTAPQSIYGLHDDSRITRTASGVSIGEGTPIHDAAAVAARPDSLVQQRYTHSVTAQGTAYHYASTEPVTYVGADRKRGWWIDLPHAGQRVLHNPRGFEGQKILVHSVVPDLPTRDYPVLPWDAGRAYLSVLNMLTGRPPAQPAFIPAEASVAPAGIGMASTVSGPAMLFREPGQVQLRYPAQPGARLRTGTTTGARAGWRERP